MSKYITLVEGDLVCNLPKGMTNGETLLAVYPNTEVEICEQYNTVRVWFAIDKDHHFKDISFGLDWWNAPYQKGGECE